MARAFRNAEVRWRARQEAHRQEALPLTAWALRRFRASGWCAVQSDKEDGWTLHSADDLRAVEGQILAGKHYLVDGEACVDWSSMASDAKTMTGLIAQLESDAMWLRSIVQRWQCEHNYLASSIKLLCKTTKGAG